MGGLCIARAHTVYQGGSDRVLSRPGPVAGSAGWELECGQLDKSSGCIELALCSVLPNGLRISQ